MRLTGFRVFRFRNFERVKLSFTSRITVLNGDNAQGKTNLIEAMAVLGSLRSFRTRKLADLILGGVGKAEIDGDVTQAGLSSSLNVSIQQGGKTALIDGRNPTSAQEYLSVFHPVLFTPWDLDISLGSQELRRAYIDKAAFLRNQIHILMLRRYDKLLRHRNILLRDPYSSLSIWNEQIAQTAVSVRAARMSVLADLKRFIEQVHSDVSGGSEKLEIGWEGYWALREPNAESMLRELEETEQSDRKAGHTTIGPHRDRLRINLSGRDTRAYASRGQHRTVALSLKIGFLLWATEILGEPPVFLLDDPGSELDEQRISYIGSFLSRWTGQVIIACTPEANVRFTDDVDLRFCRVSCGTVTAVS